MQISYRLDDNGELYAAHQGHEPEIVAVAPKSIKSTQAAALAYLHSDSRLLIYRSFDNFGGKK